MPDFKIYESEDELVKTTLHGMVQDAFVVTEERVNNFNNYSNEFQISLALFSTALGVALGSLGDIRGIVFIVSFIIAIFLGVFLFWTWVKFGKAKKNLFIKPTNLFKNKGLEIINAVYGSSEKEINITEQIISMISDGKLNIKVSNSIGGDPDPGVVKRLKVSYKISGQIYEKTVNEGSQLLI